LNVHGDNDVWWTEIHTVELKIRKIIILSVVLYGCGTSPATLSEEHKTEGVQEQNLTRRKWL
jgi:hypothetical protein